MNNISVISVAESELAPRLGRLHDPPRRLWLQGSFNPHQPQLAVVGSRRCTDYGRHATEKLVGDIAAAGVNIISGLALGIDSIAHRAALAAGGQTAAVLPGGLQRIYPASHGELARTIVERGGSLVSEYPPDRRAAKYHFIARNRIVAGLADAVLIVEAAERSGTLSTAGYALDIGIPVFAVPGPITAANSAGTNRLIQTGALVATEASDILEELGIKPEAVPHRRPDAANALQAEIFALLSRGPQEITVMLASIDASAAEIQRELTLLELNKQIKQIGGNTWCLQ